MNQKIDPNVLLLQLLAHDLLAPLTAVKWQVELLGKNAKDREKRERYLEGITKSTELGIAIVKHAHIASKVLSHTYEDIPGEPLMLSETVSSSAQELVRQYERHALALDISVEKDVEERIFDTALVALLVWALGKYFLSCSPPNTLVTVQGRPDESGTYIVRMASRGVPDSEVYARAFTEEASEKQFDQGSIFSALLKETSTRIGAQIQCEANDGELSVAVVFPAQ